MSRCPTNHDLCKPLDAQRLFYLQADIQEVAGRLQLCAGQWGGIKAAVHAMKVFFLSADSNKNSPLVDASNTLNREVALHNIHKTPLLLCYQHL